MESKKTKSLISVLIFIILAFIFFMNFKNNESGNYVHKHAGFKAYINGKLLNFSQEKYMLKNKEVHIEEMDGGTIHTHASGITIGYFFATLGIKLNDTCFILDIKKGYCTRNNKNLKFYVNGRRNYEYGDYEIRDNDRYLISYGNETEIELQSQLNSV